MRVWNWVEMLHNTVDDVASGRVAFDYGTFNCGLFAARCADAIRETGGAEAELRTHFTDEASARAWLEAAGGMRAALGDRLGSSVPWWLLQRGDLCVVITEDGEAAGVCMGEAIALLAPKGIVYLKLDKAVVGWKVD